MYEVREQKLICCNFKDQRENTLRSCAFQCHTAHTQHQRSRHISRHSEVLYWPLCGRVPHCSPSSLSLSLFVPGRNKDNHGEMYTPVDSSGEAVMPEAQKRSVSLNDNQLSTIASGGIVVNKEIILAKVNI